MDEDRPLAVVSEESLFDELLRLAAAAGCELERAPDVIAARRRWSRAPLLLLDEAAAAACAAASLPRRDGVLVVCAGDPPPEAWRQAVAIGAERVVSLPDAESWLVGVLADTVEAPCATAGRVFAVLGGRGGAGASVLAAALALVALRNRGNALLVDCDPLGGGIDLLMGAETRPGLRWPELRLNSGRLTAASLRSALPGRERGGARLTVVSCDRGGPGPTADALAAVVDAGRRGGETVVCDLPRHLPEDVGVAVDRADLVVLVVPAEVRAVAAARRVVDRLSERGSRVEAVVRGPAPGGLMPQDVARVVGVPLLASMRPEPGLPETLERGELRVKARGPLFRVAKAVLDAPGAEVFQDVAR